MWGSGPRGNSATYWPRGWLSITSPTTHTQSGPFWWWVPGWYICVRSRPLWVSWTLLWGWEFLQLLQPLQVFTTRGFEALFPHARTLYVRFVSLPNCSSLLSAEKCQTTQSASHGLAEHPLYSGCPSLPLLQVWVNISSLTSWLLDFRTVQFSGNSGYFLFLNLLLYFWLCKEAKCIYLCLHLGQKLINKNLKKQNKMKKNMGSNPLQCKIVSWPQHNTLTCCRTRSFWKSSNINNKTWNFGMTPISSFLDTSMGSTSLY